MHLLLKSPRVGEFIRYSVVGASSTAIDFGMLALLTDFWTWHPLAANPIAFVTGLTNGFIWNRYWTFRGARHDEPVGQYLRFLVVHLCGLALDQTILAAALALGPGLGATPDVSKWAGKIMAVPLVVAWNFTANALWTFRRRRVPEAEPRHAPVSGPPPPR